MVGDPADAMCSAGSLGFVCSVFASLVRVLCSAGSIGFVCSEFASPVRVMPPPYPARALEPS